MFPVAHPRPRHRCGYGLGTKTGGCHRGIPFLILAIAIFLLVSLPHRQTNEFRGREFVDGDVSQGGLQLFVVLGDLILKQCLQA